MAVTMISSAFCQRERCNPAESRLVINLEPTTSISITSQVNRMVALSRKSPCSQKIISSGLRRMGYLRRQARAFAGEARHQRTREQKTDQARDNPLPLVTSNQIKPADRHAHPQDKAGEEPERGARRGRDFLDRPPKPAKKERPQRRARRGGEQ